MQQFCDCEVSGIAATLASTYDKPCIIQRDNGTQGSLGYQDSNLPEGVNIFVGLDTPSARLLALYADQIGDQLTWQVHAPLGTDVQMRDLLTVAGQTLTVQAILDPESFDFEINLLASQVKGQGQVQVG